MSKQKRLLYLCFVVLSVSSCTKVRKYTPVSGGELVKIQPAGIDVEALQTENSKFRVQMTGSLSHGDTPRFVFMIENRTQAAVDFDASKVTALLIEANQPLSVSFCYKPPANKFIVESSDFTVPCENKIEPGEKQTRFLYFSKLLPPFKEYDKPAKPHSLRITAPQESGIAINFFFEYREN